LTTATQQKTRRFRMHENLLYDVIRRQAGSLAKAILELVMNSVDAKASHCNITLDADTLTVADNGQGITKKTHIEKWFEVFGQPHEDSEGKVYGTFRMGRGQAMAFGVNLWRTGRFKMDVDIKQRGLDYQLTDNLEPVKGCSVTISLYDSLFPSQLAETERTIREWVKYAPIPVFWNGEQITVDVKSEEWDEVTPEAYVRLRPTGSLAIYNLGIHTMDVGAYRYGSGGVIVARKQLRVNLARNDVQSDCEVWKKITPLIEKMTNDQMIKKTQLTDAERQRLADKLLAGTLNDWEGLKLFTAVNGRHYSFDQCLNSYRHNNRLTYCKIGDRIGDRLLQERAAFVFASCTLDRFHVSSLESLVTKLMPWLSQTYLRDRLAKKEILPFSQLSDAFDSHFELVSESDLTPNERIWRSLILASQYAARLNGTDPSRKILIGDSEVAEAWTDGATFVAFSRQFLRNQELTIGSFCRVGLVLIHELCHECPDNTNHGHTQEFYEKYHDHSMYVGQFADACISKLPSICATEGRRLTKRTLKDRDRLERIERAAVPLGV
jgi:hypothetical protein